MPAGLIHGADGMGSGRRKAGARSEPQFDAEPAADVDPRPAEDAQPAAQAQPKRRPPSAQSEPSAANDDSPAPRPRARERAASPRKRKRRASGGGRGGSIFSRMFYWCLVLGLWAVIAVIGTLAFVASTLPPIQSLEVPKRPPKIEIVGLDGKILTTRGEMAGTDVSIKQLPPYLPKAFIAIEDRRFHMHYGVDPIGLARAAVANVLHRGVSQGGSTITQQLAKNLFLTQERTLWRKLQEVVLAVWLERKLSKSEILELYLNRVYFGSGAYGVEAAAQRYFGKSARQVKIAEAAMLAGLVKSPSRLAPSRNPNGAERRAQAVLTAMAELGFVTETMATSALAQPARAIKPAGAGSVNYVADWIMDVLDDLVGRVEQDLVIETSIDPVLQAAAEKALVDELALKGAEARRPAGRDRGDDACRRGARAGRRPELRREPVQPRGRRQAPARLGLQAVRVPDGDRARAHPRQRARGQADRAQRLAARELQPRVLRSGHADPGAGALAQHRVGTAHPGGRAGGGRQDRLSPRHRLQARRQSRRWRSAPPRSR